MLACFCHTISNFFLGKNVFSYFNIGITVSLKPDSIAILPTTTTLSHDVTDLIMHVLCMLLIFLYTLLTVICYRYLTIS